MRRWGGAALLAAGVGLGAVVWQRADTFRESLRYEVIDGVAYPARQEDTKAYVRQMEVFGGKGLVVAREFLDWLDGLGRSRGVAGLLVVAGIGGGVWGFWPRRESPARDSDTAGT